MSICPVIRLLLIILSDISTKPILDLSAALTEKKKKEKKVSSHPSFALCLLRY